MKYGSEMVQEKRASLPDMTLDLLVYLLEDYFEEIGVERKGINIQRLHRIEKSEVIPDDELATALGMVLGIEPEELIEGFANDRKAKRESTRFDIRSLDDFINDTQLELIETQAATEGGVPQLSTERLERILPVLRSKTGELLKQKPSKALPLVELLSIAVFQKGETFSYWQTHEESAQSLLLTANELKELSEMSGNQLPLALSFSQRASIAHLLEDEIAAFQFASDALELAMRIGTVDPNTVLELLTLKAGASAKLKHQGSSSIAQETIQEIEKMINDRSHRLREAVQRMGLITIARVESLLGSKKFWKKLEIAKRATKNTQGGYKDNYTGLRTIYTEIKAMRLLREPDMGQVDELVKEASLISEQHGRLYTEVEQSAQAVRDFFKTKKNTL